MRRIFIHLPPFEKQWREYCLSDHDLRILQLTLMLRPESGAVIQGTHGIRKIRWAEEGRGKRGSLRVFYADFPDYHKIYLITLVRKTEDNDLSQEQRNILAGMMLELSRALRGKTK